MNTLEDFPFIKNVIENWIVRLRRAGINQKQLAKESGISVVQLSKIMNFKVNSPRLSTIQKVETILESYNV